MTRNYRRTDVRQANENYGAFDLREGRGGNLTPLQRRYAHWWEAVRPFQVGRREMTSACFGFKGRKVAGTVIPISAEKRIRPLDSLMFLSIVPIPKSLFQREQQPGKYRLHFSEQVGYTANDQGHFGGLFVGQRIDPSQHRQAALDKRPLQDHPVFAQVDHNPEGLGSQLVAAVGGELATGHPKAPIYGNFAVVRDDLFLRFTIEGHDVYRFQLADIASVEILAQPGEVTAGQVLANLKGAVSYLAAEPWASNPNSKASRPVMDRIEGDSLSATHYVPQLSFAVRALELMLQRDEGQPELSHAAIPMEECWPIPLVQLPLDVFKSRRQFGWEPNAAFQAAMLYAASPDSVGKCEYLRIVSPVTGTIQKVVTHHGYRVVHFSDEAGVESTLPVPSCAVVRLEGEVRQGEPIGDLIARSYYESYAQLTDAADGCIVKLEDALMDQSVIRPDETNWRGPGVLLDERLAGVLREQAADRFVDTGPLLPYVDEEFGIATLPPVGFDVRQHGFQFQVNGIQYDTTPLGAMFAQLDLDAAPAAAQPKRQPRQRRAREVRA